MTTADRRASVVGISRKSASLVCPASAVLQEQHNDCQESKRHFTQASLTQLPGDNQQLVTDPPTAGLPGW